MKSIKKSENNTLLPKGVNKEKANKNLQKLDELQDKVTKAHKRVKVKEDKDEMKVDKYKSIGAYKKAKKREAKKEKMKLADKKRKRQLKKYNPLEGNRKKRRNKYRRKEGSRFAKLQRIPIKNKKDKVVYITGKHVLASPKKIPYGEPKKLRFIEPKFMWVPFEKIYHGNVTIDGEIRRIETGRYTEWKRFLVGYETKIVTTNINCYIPVEFKTITQHLYPPRIQKRVVENKKRLAELQKIAKESKDKQDKEKKGD